MDEYKYKYKCLKWWLDITVESLLPEMLLIVL